MTGSAEVRRRAAAPAAAALLALCGLAGCGSPAADRFQGYVEGEYVYVASPLGGALEALYVRRGARVKAGDPLFALDDAPERAARDEAARKLAQARATWEDAKKGKRKSEIESLEAQLRQARAALDLSGRDVARYEKLAPSGGVSSQDLDRARSTHEQNRDRVAQLEADLKTARLGARSDQVVAAEASVRAQEAALAKADWDLAQKRQNAPQTGAVFDTLFREGEWVPAGRPVVALLPPQNVLVRVFVPQGRVGAIKMGDAARVTVDGVAEPFEGRVSFISPQAEYTPPVIYSRESRAKLVFKVELVFDPEAAAKLHPGQPVDVEFP
jgi:HlyD family secretion protein